MKNLDIRIPITMNFNQQAMILPCTDTSRPSPPEPFKIRFLRTMFRVLKYIGFILGLMTFVVLLTIGAGILDRYMGTGNMFTYFSYAFSLMLGIIASMILDI